MSDENVSDALRALPVLIQVSHTHASSVRRFVDGVLGWQPVEHDALGPLRARIQLTDDPLAVSDALPTVLLVDDDGLSGWQAKQLADHPGAAVCLWPSERAELPALVTTMLAQHTKHPHVSTLTVGGAAGGVGTTTVALVLAGLSAADTHNTLAVINDQSSTVRLVPTAALADPALWTQATAVAGVSACRVVCVSDAAAVTPVRDPQIAQTVYDVGVAHDVDVLVLRPDRAGLYALGRTTASVVVVVGAGAYAPAKIDALAGSRRVVHVEHSMRVARAVALERVPAGCPGRWLAPLSLLVRSGELFASG
jgi:hypothetical protein